MKRKHAEECRRRRAAGGGRLINALCCRHARKKQQPNNPYLLSPERTEPPVSVRFRQASESPATEMGLSILGTDGAFSLWSHPGILPVHRDVVHDELPWE